jgi:hypothetical protein
MMDNGTQFQKTFRDMYNVAFAVERRKQKDFKKLWLDDPEFKVIVRETDAKAIMVIGTLMPQEDREPRGYHSLPVWLQIRAFYGHNGPRYSREGEGECCSGGLCKPQEGIQHNRSWDPAGQVNALWSKSRSGNRPSDRWFSVCPSIKCG